MTRRVVAVALTAVLAVAGAVVALAIVGTDGDTAAVSPSYALTTRDMSETTYLAALDDGGIAYPDAEAAIAAAREVCRQYDDDVPYPTIIATILGSGPLSAVQAGYVHDRAVYSFCSDYTR